MADAIEMAEKLSNIFNLPRLPEVDSWIGSKQSDKQEPTSPAEANRQEHMGILSSVRRNSVELVGQEHQSGNRTSMRRQKLRFEDQDSISCWTSGEKGHTKWNCMKNSLDLHL